MLFIVLGLSFVIHYYQFVLQAPWKVFSWSKMLQCEYWQELERTSVFLPGWFNMSIHDKLTLRKRAKWDVIYLCGDDVLLKRLVFCVQTMSFTSSFLSLSAFSLPPTRTDMMMVTPINDLHGWEPGSMVKGERLMRCKLASTHRLFDLFGWAQIGRTCLTVSSAAFSHYIRHFSLISFKKH